MGSHPGRPLPFKKEFCSFSFIETSFEFNFLFSVEMTSGKNVSVVGSKPTSVAAAVVAAVVAAVAAAVVAAVAVAAAAFEIRLVLAPKVAGDLELVGTCCSNYEK